MMIQLLESIYIYIFRPIYSFDYLSQTAHLFELLLSVAQETVVQHDEWPSDRIWGRQREEAGEDIEHEQQQQQIQAKF